MESGSGGSAGGGGRSAPVEGYRYREEMQEQQNSTTGEAEATLMSNKG